MGSESGHAEIANLLKADKGRNEDPKIEAAKKAIIAAGIKIVDWKDKEELGYALIGTAIRGNFDVTKALIELGANLNSQISKGFTPLTMAVHHNRIDIVKALITAGVNVNLRKDDWTPLMMAADLGHIEIVNALLRGGADKNLKNNQNKTALELAEMKGHAEIVNALDAGKDRNEDPKIEAAKRALATAGIIIRNWKDPNELGATLTRAAKTGNQNVVKALIEAGINLNFQDKDGTTALISATEYGHADTAETLRKAGAKVNLQNKNGWTSLMWAAHSGKNDLIKSLIASGANIHLQHNTGKTALTWAAENNHLEAVKILVAAGAPTSLQDWTGVAALMAAASKGNVEIAKFLIAKNANLKGKPSLVAQFLEQTEKQKACQNEIEFSQFEAFFIDFIDKLKKKPFLPEKTGLDNKTRTTCFLNSTIKLLKGHPEISKILNPTLHKLEPQKENPNALSARKSVQSSLSDLVEKIKATEEGQCDPKDCFREELCDLIANFNTFLNVRNGGTGNWFTKENNQQGGTKYTYIGQDQQDAAEFLDETLKLLDYQRVSKLKASHNPEPLNFLQLPTPPESFPGQEVSLHDAIKNFNNESTLMIGLEGLPKSVIFQLNRHAPNGQKLQTAVSLSPQMDLRFQDRRRPGARAVTAKYAPKAVIVHKSHVAQFGHYIAYVYDETRKKWYRHDDEQVNEISSSSQEFKNDVEKNGYLYLYNLSN